MDHRQFQTEEALRRLTSSGSQSARDGDRARARRQHGAGRVASLPADVAAEIGALHAASDQVVPAMADLHRQDTASARYLAGTAVRQIVYWARNSK
jgi:hypothetical protein